MGVKVVCQLLVLLLCDIGRILQHILVELLTLRLVLKVLVDDILLEHLPDLVVYHRYRF